MSFWTIISASNIPFLCPTGTFPIWGLLVGVLGRRVRRLSLMIKGFIKEVLPGETCERVEKHTRKGKKPSGKVSPGQEPASVGSCGGTLGCELYLSLS